MDSTIPRLRRLFLGSLLALASPALADTLDRDNSTPTGWRWYYGVASTTIDTSVSQGYRVVSLDVVSTSPLRFNVALVANSGDYQRDGSGWFFGTPAFIESKRAGRRVSALTPYVIEGELYLAASFVANTGSDAKTWSYGFGTWAAVSDQIGSYGGRIVDLDSYVIGNTRYYTAVGVRNAGADYKPWWIQLGVSPGTIANTLTANNARLIDLQAIGSGLYNAIMVRDTAEPHWWWYYGVSAAQVDELAGQLGSRLIHLGSNGSTYDAIFINNSNPLTTRVGDIMRQMPTGFIGAYLKQVNGPELVDLEGSRQYEPASSLKTLHHVTAMRDVALNQVQLGWNIQSYIGGATVCPSTNFPTQLEPLSTILSAMMKNSDNTRTLTVETYFGRQKLKNVAAQLGMTRTEFNHSIGCGSPPNKLTLEDAGKLFEAVADGFLGPQKNNFYSLMSNNTLASTIDAEAAKLALPAAVVTAFKSYVLHVWKGGSYGVSLGSHRSHVGWFRLPFCVDNKIQMREFVYGNFCNNVQSYGSNQAAYDQILFDGREAMRAEMVRQALQTWKDGRILGDVTAYGNGCTGSNGVVTHTSGGTPEAGRVQTFLLGSGPKSAVAVLHLGASRTKWGAIPLPLSLTSFGAPGCSILAEPTLAFGVATSASGAGSFQIAYPDAKGIAGVKLFSQYLCVDAKGNALGLTLSNGLETLVGGWPK